ncbi:hypothetical protein VTK73DRAFT_6978 [Phialemonium thermophilum]|uniref:Xylanolytic transcriptional activator regulatory domain-containing protein n=1 Tax=Phialemonium thermophilum TaxID=223376 RepID=A0ABR3WH17_9PEZI
MGRSPYTPPVGHANGGMTNGIDYIPDGSYPQIAGQRSVLKSPPDPQRTTVQTSSGPYGVLSPVSDPRGYPSQPTNVQPSAAAMQPYVTPPNFPPFSLPPSDFAPSPTTVTRETQRPYVPPSSDEYSEQAQPQTSDGDMMMLDSMGMATATMSVFGDGTTLNKSPHVGMPEDFMAYIFSLNSQGGSSPTTGVQSYGEFTPTQYAVPYLGVEPTQLGYFPSTAPQQIMSVTNLVDKSQPEAVLSDEKAEEIYEYIRERFHENGHSPIERQRESILEGDRNDDSHMLSRRMMQAYIASYWHHFSDQVPILHKPTFAPDRTHNLLLIAMMTIGAACLDKAHGQKVTKAGAKLSNFLAWHLRWEMFQDRNCRPPAPLWIFQALLLLELYEKMYSTRELHERAHIHHATTITLMRRGRALIGKSTLDSPPNPRDLDKQDSSRQSSMSGAAHTADEWWNHWITNEATRRAAFVAFIIDSVHATMFGHSTVMVAHEMRLPLPCDEKLWNATSGAEVARIDSDLVNQGIKPISFLEGLKRTLSNQEVHTNSFGRTVLMAGLLSVSWHMNQRDLQVSSLGNVVSQALGGRDKWRGTLTRAFDSWKNDFDKALLSENAEVSDPYAFDSGAASRTSVVLETRTVMHHLAHMAMHVDIVQLQIFARAKRLLGRVIGIQDLNSTQRRIRDVWAPSAKARDATYYALKFLCSVLVPEESGEPLPSAYERPDEPYSTREDNLLNRPWVLYFAALVVWCYGYAREGPCPGFVPPTTKQEKVQRMRDYLHEYGRVSSPDELKLMTGINQNTALLMVLKDSFEDARWELLHEGAMLMQNCINLNAGLTVR